jgi:hypothetical protein
MRCRSLRFVNSLPMIGTISMRVSSSGHGANTDGPLFRAAQGSVRCGIRTGTLPRISILLLLIMDTSSDGELANSRVTNLLGGLATGMAVAP